MVTRKSVKESEWTQLKENMSIDQAKLNEPTLALLASISKENGLEYWQLFKKSVTIPKYIEWLDGLRAANPDEKICLYIDNLKAHVSEEA